MGQRARRVRHVVLSAGAAGMVAWGLSFAARVGHGAVLVGRRR